MTAVFTKVMVGIWLSCVCLPPGRVVMYVYLSTPYAIVGRLVPRSISIYLTP